MKNIKLVLTCTLLSLLILSNCDNRKDKIAELEQSANQKPVLEIQRYGSVNPFKTTFTDTFLVLTGTYYRLAYKITDDNIDMSTLKINCIIGCGMTNSATIKQDSSIILIQTPVNSLVSYEISVKDKFGVTGSAVFTLVNKNGKPQLTMKKLGFAGAYVKTLIDTNYYLMNPSYTAELNLTDDNATYSNVQVFKKTPGDNNVINLSGNTCSFNFTNASPNKLYQYQFIVTDPAGFKDTCYFNCYVMNKRPLLKIRRQGGSAFVKQIPLDTLKTGLGYNYVLELQIDDETATGSNAVILKKTTGDVSIITKNTGTISIDFSNNALNKQNDYQIYIVDPQGQIGDTCSFSVYVYNKRPLLKIKRQGVGTFKKDLGLDSMKTSFGFQFTLDVQIDDETATGTNCVIIKKTSGDQTTFTKSTSSIVFDFTNTALNNKYDYEVYTVDQLGLIGDTCKFSLYVFKNLLPVFYSVGPHSLSTTYSTYNTATYAYLDTYVNPPSSGVHKGYPCSITLNAKDQDANQGGYITKVRWQYIFYHQSAQLYYQIFDINYALGAVIKSDYPSPYTISEFCYPSPQSPPITWNLMKLQVKLFDNSGDSTGWITTFAQFP